MNTRTELKAENDAAVDNIHVFTPVVEGVPMQERKKDFVNILNIVNVQKTKIT